MVSPFNSADCFLVLYVFIIIINLASLYKPLGPAVFLLPLSCNVNMLIFNFCTLKLQLWIWTSGKYHKESLQVLKFFKAYLQIWHDFLLSRQAASIVSCSPSLILLSNACVQYTAYRKFLP